LRLDLSHKFVLGFVVVATVAAGLPSVLEAFGVPAWGSFFFGLGVGAGIGLLYSRQITSNLKTLRSCTEAISRGDLTMDVAVRAGRHFPDETVDLARSVALMLSSLRELVGRMQQTADEVAQASRGISESSRRVNSANQEVSDNMESAVHSALKEQEDVKHISLRMHEISSAMQANAEAAREASSLSTESSQQTKACVQVSRSSAGKMRSLFEKIEESERLMQDFEQKIRSAHRVSEMISSVVEKTHLLSLNASIEAARAGDAGRGFTVVAEEIRKLAETAGESAGQIEKLVGQLEEGSGNISTITQSMGEEVRERREDLTEILQALERVQGSIEKASSRAEQIVEQATHQSADGEQLMRDIETIAREVTNGAKATDEMRGGLSGQREAMDEMVREVARLSGMSSELNEVVQRFRTR
jgi:methyl-accepting chemotaxis protein